MLKILTFTLLAVFTLHGNTTCYENYEMYQKCKKVKKVIKNNRGDVPDYVLQDAAKGYLERPSEYQEEPFYWHSELHEKTKGRHHDEK